MGQQLDPMGGPFIPTFNLQERDYGTMPQPHDTGSFRLVVPVHGADTDFIWKVSQILEISFDRSDVYEMSFLSFVVHQSLSQMFTNFDRSPAVFLSMLQGSFTDQNIPGLPTKFYFQQSDLAHRLINDVTWPQFVVIFRDAAMAFYNYVLAFANMPNYAQFHFTYQGYPQSGGGLAFILSLNRGVTHYDI